MELHFWWTVCFLVNICNNRKTRMVITFQERGFNAQVAKENEATNSNE